MTGPAAPGGAVLGTDTDEARWERSEVAAGRLPPRYGEDWTAPFVDAARPALVPEVRILDVGGGRRPTLAVADRPAGATYVGLDISEAELARAPAGTYDSIVVADISVRKPALEGDFDLVLAWQVLEHVPDLDRALANLRGYLRPGGRLVAQLSGTFSVFGVLARVVPYRVSRSAMQRLLGADPEEKFPTHYDRCWYAALDKLLGGWSEHGMTARYKGARYFRFWRPLERAYLRYEDAVARRGWANLATHYVIWAVR